MAMGSARTPYSGLVEVSGRLGLPALPFASAAVAQLDATSRVRAWWVSPSLWRTDSLSAFGQREDVAFAAGVLEWDYESTTVHVQPSVPGIRQPRTDDLLPPSAARLLLSWASPQDTVTALPARTIAGRDASGARVSSGEPGSSVRSLDVWVDTSSGLPVELDVRARAVADPVLTTRFLDLSVQRPSDRDVSPALSDSCALVGGPSRRPVVRQDCRRQPVAHVGARSPAVAAGIGRPPGRDRDVRDGVRAGGAAAGPRPSPAPDRGERARGDHGRRLGPRRGAPHPGRTGGAARARGRPRLPARRHPHLDGDGRRRARHPHPPAGGTR